MMWFIYASVCSKVCCTVWLAWSIEGGSGGGGGGGAGGTGAGSVLLMGWEVVLIS